MEIVLTNAKVVAPQETFLGTVVVRDGQIAAIDQGVTGVSHAVDLNGQYLLPGLIEVHTDHAEQHFVPRSGYIWPSRVSSLLSHDAQMAGSGITTVYDAISVGVYDPESKRGPLLELIIDAIRAARKDNILRSDHHIHLRCEVSDDGCLDLFEQFSQDPIVSLISLMDHTPGQRQWRDLERLRHFSKDKVSVTQFDAMIEARIASRSPRVEENKQAIMSRWNARALPSASHDDTTPEHVDEAVALGINISEFPCTLEAAQHARRKGMQIIMGAPNLVRGSSHSGNVSALELAEAGLLDGLSSDYMPLSLLDAVFVLNEKVGMSLSEAADKVSAGPARMLGLGDRGSISLGLRGDLVAVQRSNNASVVRSVWRQGDRVS